MVQKRAARFTEVTHQPHDSQEANVDPDLTEQIDRPDAEVRNPSRKLREPWRERRVLRVAPLPLLSPRQRLDHVQRPVALPDRGKQCPEYQVNNGEQPEK